MSLRNLLACPPVATFAARAETLERLELLMLGELPPELQARAEALKVTLEHANERFVERLRERLKARRYSPHGLRRTFARLAGDQDYDTLDQLVAALLDVGELPAEQTVREAEMVFYQPTPARVILALASRLEPGDVFYDLGSGLGHVVILVALLTGARAYGIEIEPTYARHARRAAGALNLPEAVFVEADARTAAFDDGTAFFLYTPFRGALLKQVLDRLPAGCRVYTHGPCSEEVRDLAPWLAPMAL
ncbi:MAG TPA: hypothetical protein V6D47_10570 [Oscillatoriaceae cyanobacterium]